jgi:hypothetical protein
VVLGASEGAAVVFPDIISREVERSFCAPIVSIVSIMCLCSVLVDGGSPGSRSHSGSYDVGCAAVCP